MITAQEANGVLAKSKLIGHGYLPSCAVLSSSANLNLGAILLSRFWSCAHCPWANKGTSVQLACLRHDLLTCFAQCCVSI